MRVRGDDNKMQDCVWIDKDMNVGYHYDEDRKQMMMLLYLGRRRRRCNDAGDAEVRKVSLACRVWCAGEY